MEYGESLGINYFHQTIFRQNNWYNFSLHYGLTIGSSNCQSTSVICNKITNYYLEPQIVFNMGLLPAGNVPDTLSASQKSLDINPSIQAIWVDIPRTNVLFL